MSAINSYVTKMKVYVFPRPPAFKHLTRKQWREHGGTWLEDTLPGLTVKEWLEAKGLPPIPSAITRYWQECEKSKDWDPFGRARKRRVALLREEFQESWKAYLQEKGMDKR